MEYSFQQGCYDSADKLEHWKGEEVLKKRLYEQGAVFQPVALLMPILKKEEEPVILTTCKIVVKYAPIFFSSD